MTLIIEYLEEEEAVYDITVEDNANFYANGVLVHNCSEITLFSDELHSFICCLSSVNLARWNEWKDTDLIEVGIQFLNGILNHFINIAGDIKGLENAIKSAVKGRAIGLGVMGWHTLLQDNKLAFGSFESMMLNAEVFGKIKKDSDEASIKLAKEFGEPEWCKGTGYYNTHTTTVAPTRSNSIISGGVSAGIEPIDRNVYLDRTAKGNFYEKNPILEKLLESKGLNDKKTWDKIKADKGSVQKLKCLDESEKKVFLTAYELDQKTIIRQAAQRTPFIDQAQSLNLFFPQGTSAKYFNGCHILAWKLGVKTLYYCKSTSGITVDRFSRDTTIEECEACGA